jgi:hypothetical protein
MSYCPIDSILRFSLITIKAFSFIPDNLFVLENHFFNLQKRLNLSPIWY